MQIFFAHHGVVHRTVLEAVLHYLTDDWRIALGAAVLAVALAITLILRSMSHVTPSEETLDLK